MKNPSSAYALPGWSTSMRFFALATVVCFWVAWVSVFLGDFGLPFVPEPYPTGLVAAAVGSVTLRVWRLLEQRDTETKFSHLHFEEDTHVRN